MLKLLLVTTLINLIVLSNVNGQRADEAWCQQNGKPSAGDKKPNTDFFRGVYQAVIERNDLFKETTESIIEFVNGPANIAIAEQIFEGQTIKTYSYYNQDGILEVKDNMCAALPINDLSESLTPFHSVMVEGKRYVKSALLPLLDGQINLTYVGSANIRGISGDNFQACYFNPKSNTTELTTLSMSLSTWIPALTQNGVDSVPLQLEVKRKPLPGSFIMDVDVYSIHEFRNFISLSEDGYFTSPGIYCKGRKNVKEIPSMPVRFAFQLEAVLSDYRDSDKGNSKMTREEYDFNTKLFKMSTVLNNQTITEVHDFTTGLSYYINEDAGNCTLKKIAPYGIDASGISQDDDAVMTIRNPQEFFDFDGGDYSWNGERLIDGVNTDIWIGSKPFAGAQATYEWAFLAQTYDRTDDLNKAAPTPVRLTITLRLPAVPPLVPIPDASKPYIYVPLIYNFIDFRITDSIDKHHDIHQCQPPGARDKSFQISYTTDAEQLGLIKEHGDYFKIAAYDAVREKSKVAGIRLHDFHVKVDGNEVFFVFAIHEKSEIYGNVKIPLDDVSLEDAEFHLKKSVESGDLNILWNAHTNYHQYLMQVNPNSFREVENQDDGYVMLTTVHNPQGYTGATIGIVSALVAVVCVVIVLTLLILHKNQKITLPFL